MRRVSRVVVLLFGVALSACCLSFFADPPPDSHPAETLSAARIFATKAASVLTPTDTLPAAATQEPRSMSESELVPTPMVAHQSTATPTAVAPIPPRGTYRHGYKIRVDFDRLEGNTVVSLDTRRSEFGRGPGSLSVFYLYEGTTPVVPSLVSLTLVSTADIAQYVDCHDLTLLLDGQVRMPIETEHRWWVGDGFVDEWVTSYLKAGQFLEIVNAKKVEGKLCDTEFVLSSEQLEALRDLASRMQP
jgi:hypothetical protein